jgi:hypothetical protein
MFGIVPELFVVEEKLFARGEHKLSAAVDALQDPVRKFHGRLPKEGNFLRSALA